MKDGDFRPFYSVGTTEGLQAAIDYLEGGKGTVWVGPGTLETTAVLSVHSGCHLKGAGSASTTIKRASGSVSATGAAYSANLIISTQYGANGTLSTSGEPQADISVTGLTLDGNVVSNNVSFTSPGIVTGHYGIKLQFVDGVLLHDLVVKNLLQTGIDLVSCARVRASDILCKTCGQYATAASRNGFNFNNGDATAIGNGYGQDLILTNYICEGATDTNITLKNVNDVAISNCTFDGALLGIELESTAAVTSLMKNYAVSNITAKNITGNFLRLSPSAGVGFENMVFENLNCQFHATDHGLHTATVHSAALFLGRTNDGHLKRIRIKNGIFTNINTASTNSEMAMVVLGLPGTTPTTDVHLSGLSFYGANGSENNTANRGLDIYGNIENCTFEDLYLSGVEGVGVHVRTGTTSTSITELLFRNVVVDGCQEDAFKCLVDQAGASITRVEFVGCRAKNPAIALTSYRCFFIGASAAGTCTDISVRDCRGYRTSSLCNGIEVYQSAGTVDSIALIDNDFSDLGAGHAAYTATGTLTNVWFDDIPMKGTAIASAASVTLGRGNLFGVSGTTTIDTITPYSVFDCRPISFHFGTTAAMGDGTGNLRLTGTFTGVGTNDYITLRYDKANSVWFEVCRSGDI